MPQKGEIFIICLHRFGGLPPPQNSGGTVLSAVAALNRQATLLQSLARATFTNYHSGIYSINAFPIAMFRTKLSFPRTICYSTYICPMTIRRKIVAGNWKMNTSLNEAIQLCQGVAASLPDSVACEVLVFPPFPYIVPLTAHTRQKLEIGAQNCSQHTKGAYTGEVSASMIKSCGANWVLTGHSERRTFYGETDQIIAEKIRRALDEGLQVIFCIGETLAEREKNQLKEVLQRQITKGLEQVKPEEFASIVLAYEPVWAIGTGLTASPDQANEAHAFSRSVLQSIFGSEVANSTPILYGGSCNPSNAASLFSQPDIDGGLIGGASLKPDDFVAIATSF